MAERDAVWSVLEARDASVARLRAAEQALHANLVEKEGVIGKLTDDLLEKDEALRSLTSDLEGKDAALAKLTSDLETKDVALAKLTLDLEDKESRLHSLRADATEKDLAIQELQKALEEKADIKRFNTTLEEKEAVIRDQLKAIQAYKATYIMSGWLIVPLNHLILGVKGVIRRGRNALIPRLGVLYQHPPLEMKLPAGYERAGAAADAPKISMVTPSFKQAGFIERTIRSVVEQSYPNLEYFVQDGGSDDDTVDVLKRWEGRMAGWESRPDRGQAQAINRGFARTDGEIMAYLNSDDILLPGALAYVADYFGRHPEVDVVYGHRIVIDEQDRQIGRWILPRHDDKVLSWADYVPQETLFWRRRIWDKAGGRMDESFQFALDWDLLVRFREAGARFARLPRFLGGFRVHPQQKTTASIADTGFEEMNRIRKRALGRVPTSLEVRKAVAPYLVRHMAAELQWKIADRLGLQS